MMALVKEEQEEGAVPFEEVVAGDFSDDDVEEADKPMGLRNAPHSHQRFVSMAYGDMIRRCLGAYIDDTITYSKGSEAHIWPTFARD
ncbi:MAG: hypothetical protein Devi2KO_40610 [Devosia indica]